MRTLHRMATVGVGAAMTVAAIGGAASASTPKAHSVSPNYLGCTFTVSGPASYYADASFNHPIGGKHTGEKVTSELECAYFQSGFHSVRLSGGGTGYFWAANLVHPTPVPDVEARYKVTGTVNVRSAPSTDGNRSKVVGQKHAGDIVTSGLYKNDFSNNGFAEVNLGSGDIGWISSAYVQ